MFTYCLYLVSVQFHISTQMIHLDHINSNNVNKQNISSLYMYFRYFLFSYHEHKTTNFLIPYTFSTSSALRAQPQWKLFLLFYLTNLSSNAFLMIGNEKKRRVFRQVFFLFPTRNALEDRVCQEKKQVNASDVARTLYLN